MPDSRPTLLILSASRGLGKTSLAHAVAEEAAARGLRVGGVVCPSERDNEGIPQEISCRSLRSGKTMVLASRRRELEGPRLEARPGQAALVSVGTVVGTVVGASGGTVTRAGGTVAPASPDSGRPAPPPFSFSAAAFRWALGILARGLDEGLDLLVLDEVGPLELEKGDGFSPFLEKLAAGAPNRQLPSGAEATGRCKTLRQAAPGLLLLTVRPSLAQALASRFPDSRVEVQEMSLENREGLREYILSLL